MNNIMLAPTGYDVVHWAEVLAVTFIIWEILKWIRGKIKA